MNGNGTTEVVTANGAPAPSPGAKAPPSPHGEDGTSIPASPVHEAMCTQCGKCCYKKIIIGRTVFITPFPCEFLDTGSNLCTIYERRHELNPLCLSVREGLKVGAFPADCPYVPALAPTGYRPAREDLDWDREWDEFDSLADDLEVTDDMREKIRARGRHAPPMYVETNARIREQADVAAGRDARPTRLLWGEDAPAVIDLSAPFSAGEEIGAVPSLAQMARTSQFRTEDRI